MCIRTKNEVLPTTNNNWAICFYCIFFLKKMIFSSHLWTDWHIFRKGGRLGTRVSQKIQKSEFWNATYPSGFHMLDEPPEKFSIIDP